MDAYDPDSALRGRARRDPHALGVADAGVEADDVDSSRARDEHAWPGFVRGGGRERGVRRARRASTFKLNSTKSMLGHQLGRGERRARGDACLRSIRVGRCTPDDQPRGAGGGVAPTPAPNEAQEFSVRVALVQQLRFGGHNSSVVFESSRSDLR